MKRIEQHPVLKFKKGREMKFTFDGREMTGREGDTIASALIANGVRDLRESIKLNRPRGFFCAIGRCANCSMIVDGIPNTKVCITPLREGIKVERQYGRGAVREKH